MTHGEIILREIPQNRVFICLKATDYLNNQKVTEKPLILKNFSREI